MELCINVVIKMLNEEDVIRFEEAKNCKDCVGWLKNCKAECCKTVLLNMDPIVLEKTSTQYLLVKVGPISPSRQRYYTLRDVRYTRGTLRFRKDRIHVFGRKMIYMHACRLLDENNLCKGHPYDKPEICEDFTLDNAHEKDNGYLLTDNCLFKYKVKGGKK